MTSNQTLEIVFWHRKSKADLKDHATIICIISIDGKDAEFPTGQKVHIHNWDIMHKRVVRSENAKKINRLSGVLEV